MTRPADPVPVVFVPGLLCTPRLYAAQIPALWEFGPVTVADHTRDDSMERIASRILAAAPPRMALAGLSMGGYIALEIVRQAPERIVKLALLDTTARADTAEQREHRLSLIALAGSGRFREVPDLLFPSLVHPARLHDETLRQVNGVMAAETGAEAFVRQERAIMGRPDARPCLDRIRCPALVIVGDGDVLTPPDRAAEIADGIGGARLVVVPGCGHLSSLEQPEAVTSALRDWLAA